MGPRVWIVPAIAAVALSLAVAAAARPGDPDASFGSGGTVTTGFGTAPGLINSLDGARAADGSVFVLTSRTQLVRFLPDGSLDTGFGNSGFLDLAGSFSALNALLVQPDGKIVLTGASFGLNGPVAIAVRLGPDGTLDSSFGDGDGTAVLSVPGEGMDIEQSPDGRLAVGVENTYTTSCNRAICNYASDRYAVRLRADGALDQSFGGGAVLVERESSDTFRTSVDIRADGSVVLASTSQVHELVPDGSPDGTFGQGGAASVQDGLIYDVAVQVDGGVLAGGSFSGRPLVRLGPDGSVDPGFAGQTPDPSFFARDVALYPDGKILVGGTASGALALARFDPNGQPDQSLGGGDGLVKTRVDNSSVTLFGGDVIVAMSIRPDGGITAIGDAASEIALASYSAGGALDPAFGVGGISRWAPRRPSEDSALAVALQADGKVIVGGSTNADPGNSRVVKHALVRYDRDGSLDSGFGDRGRVVTEVGESDFSRTGVRALAIQPDGRIVAVGVTSIPPVFPDVTNFRIETNLLRYHEDGSLDPSFGGGDGIAVMDSTGFFPDAVALQPDGKILVLADNGKLRRFLPDGSVDESFGSGGEVPAAVNGGREGESLVEVDRRGRIVVAVDQTIARVLPDGTLDSGFGQRGRTTIGAPIRAFRIEPDGSVFAVGSVLRTITFHRLTAGGKPDRSYGGGDGFVGTRLTYQVSAAAIDRDNRAVAVGSGPEGPSIARFNPDGKLDRTFSRSSFPGALDLVAVGPRREVVVAGTKVENGGPPTYSDPQFSVTRFLGGPPLRSCDSAYATVIGTVGPDVLRGTRHFDVFSGLGGDDRIVGLGGADLICAGPGDDTVDAGNGPDEVLAGDGADIVAGGHGPDRLYGGDGPDRLLGGPGNDRLFGGRGADTLFGGPGRDVVLDGPGSGHPR